MHKPQFTSFSSFKMQEKNISLYEMLKRAGAATCSRRGILVHTRCETHCNYVRVQEAELLVILSHT